MTITVGENSYVDVAYADTYFTTRVGGAAWLDLTPEEKESALLTAMPYLENYCQWQGDKTDPEQALQWPRNGDTEVPANIKNAQCEFALSLHQAGGVATTTSAALKRLKADTVELEWMDSVTMTNSLYNSYTTVLLNGLCVPGTAQGGSGCASVIRT